MDLSGLSIIELKQLLAQVNHDLKLNKPTMSRKAKSAAKKAAVNNTLSELAECNIIAKRFSGNKALPIEHNKKIKQDIQIQQDILDYLNNGGHITTRKSRKKIKPLSTVSFYHKVSL
jgi:hypothetical protein